MRHPDFRLICLALAAMLPGAGCGPAKETGAPGGGPSQGGQLVIAVLPKLVNIDYFDACRRGAERAASDTGVKLIYDGPTEPSGAEQNKYIDTWIRQRVDAICIAPNQPKTIKRFVQKAQAAGIKVITWDSDAKDSGRDLMINQVDDKSLGALLIDDLARQMNEQGEWAIAIASLDATNLNAWRKYAEERAAAKYPKLRLVATVVTNEDENLAREKVATLLNKHPKLKGVIGFDSNSLPGAAEALKQANRVGQVALTGCSTPGKMRPYLQQDVLESFYLWDPRALGDLTVRCAKALAEGKKIAPGVEISGHGKLKFSPGDDTMVILSDPIRFTKDNIDEHDFGI